jgi:hypothetical protein
MSVDHVLFNEYFCANRRCRWALPALSPCRRAHSTHRKSVFVFYPLVSVTRPSHVSDNFSYRDAHSDVNLNCQVVAYLCSQVRP